MLVVLFTCLIPYSLISLQPLEKYVDVLCNAVKHNSLLLSAEDRLCMLTGAGAGTRGGHLPQTAAGRSSSLRDDMGGAPHTSCPMGDSLSVDACVSGIISI